MSSAPDPAQPAAGIHQRAWMPSWKAASPAMIAAHQRQQTEGFGVERVPVLLRTLKLGLRSWEDECGEHLVLILLIVPRQELDIHGRTLWRGHRLARTEPRPSRVTSHATAQTTLTTGGDTLCVGTGTYS
jgi:hypothetical protein